MNRVGSDGFSAFQGYLQRELTAAVAAYSSAHASCPSRREAASDPDLSKVVRLSSELQQKRIVVLLLAACSVEAAINFWLSLHTSGEQFEVLERATVIEKWTVCPSYILSDFEFPKDGVLYQDLKRLHCRRNDIVHLKERVTNGSAVVHAGSLPDTVGDEHTFTLRCGSLPDRLIKHLALYADPESILRLRIVLGLKLAPRKPKKTTAT